MADNRATRADDSESWLLDVLDESRQISFGARTSEDAEPEAAEKLLSAVEKYHASLIALTDSRIAVAGGKTSGHFAPPPTWVAPSTPNRGGWRAADHPDPCRLDSPACDDRKCAHSSHFSSGAAPTSGKWQRAWHSLSTTSAERYECANRDCPHPAHFIPSIPTVEVPTEPKGDLCGDRVPHAGPCKLPKGHASLPRNPGCPDARWHTDGVVSWGPSAAEGRREGFAHADGQLSRSAMAQKIMATDVVDAYEKGRAAAQARITELESKIATLESTRKADSRVLQERWDRIATLEAKLRKASTSQSADVAELQDELESRIDELELEVFEAKRFVGLRHGESAKEPPVTVATPIEKSVSLPTREGVLWEWVRFLREQAVTIDVIGTADVNPSGGYDLRGWSIRGASPYLWERWGQRWYDYKSHLTGSK